MGAVHRYEGTVNQVMGDGIMALFGAPLAHEDHAVRTCYAAVAMQEGIRRYTEELARGPQVGVAAGVAEPVEVFELLGAAARRTPPAAAARSICARRPRPPPPARSTAKRSRSPPSSAWSRCAPRAGWP